MAADRSHDTPGDVHHGPDRVGSRGREVDVDGGSAVSDVDEVFPTPDEVFPNPDEVVSPP